ncbi:MAG: response regulator transcription factor, partial [Chloroflexi bacterium]|nr:response regulator transcription factor [Chloroflexota bacterium]
AMTEPRPYRPALASDAAADALRGEARQGRFDARATDAVIACAGKAGGAPRGMARSWPAGLSDREVEVLGLVARGESNPSIARRLGISRRTAEHHVQHVYDKIGLATRAGAALFAVEHGLVPTFADNP